MKPTRMQMLSETLEFEMMHQPKCPNESFASNTIEWKSSVSSRRVAIPFDLELVVASVLWVWRQFLMISFKGKLAGHLLHARLYAPSARMAAAIEITCFTFYSDPAPPKLRCQVEANVSLIIKAIWNDIETNTEWNTIEVTIASGATF